MSLELTVLEKHSPIQLFQENGLDPVLEAITKEVKSFVPDLTTEKGRKEIASLAYKVSKSKTLLDDLGKDLVSEWKEQSKKVDNERKRVREYLDKLRDEVRAPLTEYEEREEKRLQRHKAGISAIEDHSKRYTINDSAIAIKDQLNHLRMIELTVEVWDEFVMLAKQKTDEAIEYLSTLLAKREQMDKEQAELEALRKEKAEREKREHEERIAKEAADKARIEAEAKAKAEQDRLEKEKRDAEIKASQEKERLEREKQEAINKQKRAEEDARLAKEKAEREKIEAEKRAKENEEKAREEERLRIQRENERIEQEAKKREADAQHRKKINNEILDMFKTIGLDEETAKVLIGQIALGKVPHMKINY